MKVKALWDVIRPGRGEVGNLFRGAVCLAVVCAGLVLGYVGATRALHSDLPEVKSKPRPAQRGRPGAMRKSPAVSGVMPDFFRDGTVLSLREEQLGSPGKVGRVKVVRVKSKYSLVRVEETVVRPAAPAEGDAAERVVERRAMVADHIIVKLKPGVSVEEFHKLNAKFGGRVRRKMRTPGLYVVQLARHDADAVQRAVARYRGAAALVAHAEPDYVVYALGAPDDADFSKLWGMHNTGQTGGTADADIDAVEAWNITTGSHNVLVGVIDTGIDRDHVDLAANMWTNPGEIPGNGVDDDGNGYIDDVHGWDFYNDDNDPDDDHYHGTHVAGTIGGAGNNAQGVAGVSWEVSLVGLKFLSSGGSGFLSDAIDAIYYATGIGCDLTSNSWGGGGFSQVLKDAIEDAGANDVLFVAAAGNNGANADVSPMYPAAYDSANIISVAATDHNDGLAGFSNYGLTRVDLGAPGVNVYSSKPGDTYGKLSGTSMATPHVAGACALLKSLVPGMTAAQIKTRIMAQTDPIPALNGKCVSGGRLNAWKLVMVSQDPLLTFHSAVTDDAAGNGDGLVNPGESISVTVTLKNVGLDPAAGVNAVLSTTDPNASVTDANAAFGNVPGFGGTKAALDSFTVQIDAGCPTPRDVTLDLTITDGAAGTWTASFIVTVYTSSRISGQVVTLAGGAPLPGALITYSGPTSGSVTADAGGDYAIAPLRDGTYTLVAKAAGYLDSAAQVVSVPPDALNVDFAMGAPEIDVAPAALAGAAGQWASTTVPLTISNTGDAALTWSISAGPGWTADGLWHQSSRRSSSGLTSWYYGIENQWNYNNGATNSGSLTSGPITLPGGASSLSFWQWRRTEGGSYYDKSLVQVSTDGGASWTTLVQSTVNNSTWVQANVDLSAYAGQSVRLRFHFDTVDSILNSYEGWYLDDIRVNASPLGWLGAAPLSGTIAPGGAQTVDVTMSAADLVPGVYQAALYVASNDPDEPSVAVPVTFTVTASDNTPPEISNYFPETPFTMEAGTSQVFQVWPKDADGDALDCYWRFDGAGIGGAGTSTSYSPNVGAVGAHTLSVMVADGRGGIDTHTWAIAVTSPAADPAISASESSLSPAGKQGANVADQTFEVWNGGGGTLTYTISDDVAWLSCAPSNGVSTGEHDIITVTYDTSGLAAGTYAATITIAAAGAANSPRTIAVTVIVAQKKKSGGGGGGGGGGGCALASGSGSALGWWLPYLAMGALCLLMRGRRRWRPCARRASFSRPMAARGEGRWGADP